MANQKLNDILTYIETKGATIPLLSNKIKVCKKGEPYPGIIKDYGLRIYLGLEKPKEEIRKKIGPIVNEIWRINVDVIINRSLVSRQLYSDTYGVSYWVDKMTSTFMNQNNSGAFRDSFWEFAGQEDRDEAVIVRGIFQCEVVNTY